ncbi:MAG: AgmX/PglI C-terminal domain-containing protein [bacterium]
MNKFFSVILLFLFSGIFLIGIENSEKEKFQKLEKDLMQEIEKEKSPDEQKENIEMDTFKAIQSQIKKHMKKIEYFYNKTLENKPNLKGKIVIQITITSKGLVEKCKIISSTLEDKEFENTIIKKITKWKFTEINENLPPFVFSFVFFPPYIENTEQEKKTY